MLSRSIKSLLILSFIFALPACSIAGDDNAIMPFAVGNYWVNETETQMGDTPIPSRVDTQKVDTEITWGEHTWYGLNGAKDGSYSRNAKEGTYNLLINPENPDGKAELLFEYPIKVGASWSQGAEPNVVTMVVEALDETVTVPAGKFEGCCLCKMTMPGGTASMWFKPGVGNVKMVMKIPQGEMEMTIIQQLKEYHLK